jgi:hypothetical protein
MIERSECMATERVPTSRASMGMAPSAPWGRSLRQP